MNLTLGLGFRASKIKRDKLFKYLILLFASILAFTIRLFSIIKYEPVIHEIDPYFQLRATQYLDQHGFYKFLNWYDSASWYPLGRTIGSNTYPGLMMTTVTIKNILKFLGFPIKIETMCIFIAPIFSIFTVLITYLLTKELSNDYFANASGCIIKLEEIENLNEKEKTKSKIKQILKYNYMSHDPGPGLLAAALISINPAICVRSMSGSYDNESISIFIMLLCFYCWIKAVKSGKISWAVYTSLRNFLFTS